MMAEKRNRLLCKGLAAVLMVVMITGIFQPQAEASSSLGTSFYEQEYPIVPGLSLNKKNYEQSHARQATNVLRVDVSEPHLSVDVAFSEPINSLTRLTDFAKRDTGDGRYVVGGINASFYYNSTPTNLVVKNNEIFRMTRASDTAYSPFHTDYAFGIDQSGDPVISGFDRQLHVTSGEKNWDVALVNASRSRDNEVIVYTPSLGYNVPNMNHDDSVEVVISGLDDDASSLSFGDTYTGTIEAVHIGRRSQTEIPEDGIVIATYGEEMVESFKSLDIGDRVTFSLPINARWMDADFILGSGPLLVNDGKRAISMNESSSFARERAPRTAVGVTADQELLMVTVDGRQTGYSEGVSLTELADYLVELGAVTAMNFDGGGSTAMTSRIRGADGPHLLNLPSDGSERAIVNAVQVFSTIKPADITASRMTVDELSSMDNWFASAIRGTSSGGLASAPNTSASHSTRSLKLSYDFTGESGVSAAYLNPKQKLLIEGKPQQLGMWVHGDGRTNWLRGLLTDAEGNRHYLNFTEENAFKKPGWQYLTANVPQAAKAPFTLQQIYVAQTNDSMKTKGTIYVNRIHALHEEGAESTSEPVHNPIGERFPDVRESNYSWAVRGTAFLADQQVITGFTDGNFRPANQVTREDVAVMLQRQLNVEASGTSTSFTDISVDRYSYDAIRAVADHGIFTGRSSEYFDPGAPITRAEVAAVLTRAYALAGASDESFEDAIGHWSEAHIDALLANGITTGYTDHTFRPDHHVTRAEFAAFLYRTVTLND